MDRRTTKQKVDELATKSYVKKYVATHGVTLPISESDVTGLVSDLAGKQPALGFTPEDVANKQTDLTASATKYPTVNAVNTGLATKQASLGYTPARNDSSFVTTASESSLSGEKVFGTDVMKIGAAASKPASGDFAGQFYFESDGSKIIWRWSGAAWVEVGRGTGINPFNQSLNTSDSPEFAALNVTGNILLEDDGDGDLNIVPFGWAGSKGLPFPRIAYVARLTQSGTSAPTATGEHCYVAGVTGTWNYVTDGDYYIDFDSPIADDVDKIKVFITLDDNAGADIATVLAWAESVTQIKVRTRKSGTLVNEYLKNASFKIEIDP